MGRLLAFLIILVALRGSAQAQVDCSEDLKRAAQLINARWSFLLFIPEYYDIGAIYAELAPETRTARIPELCADVLSRFMARLYDGHAQLLYYPDLNHTRPEIEIRSQRRRFVRRGQSSPRVRAYIVARDTTDAQLRAIEPGSEILAIDGRPIQAAYDELEARVSGSTPQWIDYMIDERLLLGPAETPVELTLRPSGGGGAATLSVARPPVMSDDEVDRAMEIYRDTFQVATWDTLAGGWGYMKFRTFAHISYNATRDAFDDAVDALLDRPGLIIDLRGNSGGHVDAATDAGGRFVNEKDSFGFFQIREPGQKHVMQVIDWSTGSYTVRPRLQVKPRKKIYSGPLVILIDRRCFSACELFTGGLQALGRALVIGETSGGGTGFVTGLKLPSGAIITFSWTYGWRPDGFDIEGNGVYPDVAVKERPGDWVSGHDRVLERAIQALEAGEAEELAAARERD